MITMISTVGQYASGSTYNLASTVEIDYINRGYARLATLAEAVNLSGGSDQNLMGELTEAGGPNALQLAVAEGALAGGVQDAIDAAATGAPTGPSPSGGDDYAALQAWATAGAGGSLLLGKRGQTFLISDTLTIPINTDFNFGGAKLVYTGSRTKPAFVVGAAGYNNDNIRISEVWVEAQTRDWTNDAFVGCRIHSLTRSFVSIRLLLDFTVGYQAYSQGQGYAYNTHLIHHLQTNKYAMRLTCNGATANGATNDYLNENIFLGGRYGQTTSTDGLGSRYGVWLEAINDGYIVHNNNHWLNPCFELNNVNEAIPFVFDNVGYFNRCTGARWESGYGPFARCTGTTSVIVGNKFEAIPFVSGGTLLLKVEETGEARLNFFTSMNQDWIQVNDVVDKDVFSSVNGSSSTSAFIRNGLFLGDSSNNIATERTSIYSGFDWIGLSGSRCVGFFVDTVGEETFVLQSVTDTTYKGRLAIAVYGADGVQLTNASGTYPDVVSKDAGAGTTYQSAFGGSYHAGSDGNILAFRVTSAVRKFRVMAHGGTTDCRIKRLILKRLTQSSLPLNPYSGIEPGAEINMPMASADPGDGVVGAYQRGQTVGYLSAGSGTRGSWTCRQAGRSAAAWVAGTAYTLGQLVLADGAARIYRCLVAGTSAGSGGPTGTATSGITDNTVTWGYVSQKATFLSSANLV